MFKERKLNKLYKQIGLAVSLNQIVDYHLALVYSFDEAINKKDAKPVIKDIETKADDFYKELSSDFEGFNNKKLKDNKIFKEGFNQVLQSLMEERDYFLHQIYKDSLLNDELYKDPNKSLRRIDTFIRKLYYLNDDLSNLIDRYNKAIERVNK